MNHFSAGDFSVLAGKFATYQHVFKGVNALVPPSAPALVNFVRHLLMAADRFRDATLGDAAQRMLNIHRDVVAGTMHSASLVIEAKNARNVINEELGKRAFLRVAADRRQYLDSPSLFGPTVANAFPSAADDVREAELPRR